MDEKVRNITLDQKYNITYLRHHNRPPHLQRAVYFNEDFLHLQRPLHPFSGLHLQQMSSRHTAEACGNLIHLIENPPFFSWCQPHAFGSERFCCVIRDCFQQLAWYITRFLCWKRGGMASSDLPFPNNAFWQSLMDSRRLDCLYKRVTYLSIVGNSYFSSWSEGNLKHETKLAIISSKLFQVLHALFFPFSVKNETWSHPIIAWKNGRPLHLVAPIASEMEWIDSRRWFYQFQMISTLQINSVKKIFQGYDNYISINSENYDFTHSALTCVCSMQQPTRICFFMIWQGESGYIVKWSIHNDWWADCTND